MRHRHIPIILLTAAVAGSCGDGPAGPGQPGEPGENVVSKEIGPDGGSITSGDGRLTLTFPEGALPAEKTVAIETLDSDNPPAPFTGMEHIDAAYDLRPDGLTPDEPITARFDVGSDPITDDGTIEMGLSVLATRGQDGNPEPLANLVKDIDPGTGSTRVTGELSHFTPLILFGERTGTFLVINGVPSSLPANETFTPQAIVTVDEENSVFFAVPEARYHDDSTFPLTVAESRDMERDGPAFVTESENGCHQTGDGLYVATVILTGVNYDFEAEPGDQKSEEEYGFLTGREVTCTAPEFSLAVQKSGDGSGTVTSEPAGIDCGVDCKQDQADFEEGVSVTLSAESVEGSVFTGWSGDLSQGEGCDGTGDCTIPINGDRTITATFETETSGGDELGVGLFEFPLRFDQLPGPEAVYRLYQRSSSSSGGSSALRASRLQVDEKQFGTLSGKLPVGFSGENGFILVDLLTDELLLSGITTLGPIGSPAFGVFGLTESPPGPNSPATVVLFGETGFGFYDTQLGGTQRGNQPTALDAFPAGGDPESGYAVGIQQGVVFIGFDAANGDHDIREFGSPASDFQGEPISAWMPDGFDPTVIPALVLARDTDPNNSLESGVYVESRNSDPPVRAADVGLDARRIRCAPNGLGTYVCAVTVFGDDEMALLTWDGTSSPPGVVGTIPVGDGPVDLDMRLLPNGSVGVVSTGFNDNTLTVLELDTGGNVLSSDTRPVPNGCLSPAHAIFVRDAVSLKVVGTCTDSDNYFVMESGL